MATRFERNESLGFLINQAGRIFARALEARLRRHGVPLGQFPLLLVLWDEDGLGQTEIARRLDIEQPTVANTVQRMVRDGLVTVDPDPDDRRRVVVRLTPKGRALEAPLTGEADAVNADASSGLAPDELEAFKKTIQSLSNRLRRSLG